MTTGELATALREVVNQFAAAGEALMDGDLTKYKAEYARALRTLDAYQNAQSSASL